MVLASFVEQVSPLPDHDYLGFVPADPGLAPHAFSRAYINFTRMADIITFRDRFDGYVFVDQQGKRTTYSGGFRWRCSGGV